MLVIRQIAAQQNQGKGNADVITICEVTHFFLILITTQTQLRFIWGIKGTDFIFRFLCRGQNNFQNKALLFQLINMFKQRKIQSVSRMK